MKGVKVEVVKSKIILTIDKGFFDNSELATEAVVDYPKFLNQLKKDIDDEDGLIEESLNEKLTEFFNQIVYHEYPGTFKEEEI